MSNPGWRFARGTFIAMSVLCATGRAAHAQSTSPAADSSGATVVSVDSVHRQGDSLLGLDKPKHFLMSAFVETVAFNSLELAGLQRRPSIVFASLVTAGAGVGREIHDRRTKGLFSLGDLAWDAIGAAAAGWMLRHTYK